MIFSRNAKIIIFICFIVAALFVGFLLLRKNPVQQEGEYTIGKYKVQAKLAPSQGSDGLTQCDYSFIYNNKTILLGTYPQKGTCRMEQAPALSNGMLAVMTQAYVFLYDPKTETVLKLDPLSISGFRSFADEEGIDIFIDFPQKTFIFNGIIFQIIYLRKTDDTRSPLRLSFISNDNGKTFTFDKNAQ